MTMTRAFASTAMAALVFATASPRAVGTILDTVVRTCPVGGERFSSLSVVSTSQAGLRLDLRPIGPIDSLPWIECPNGFIVYKDESEFTRAEIAKLSKLVVSEDYRRVRAEHVVAYRVVFLKRGLGGTGGDIAWPLMRAAWEAEDQKRLALHSQYLGEASEAFAALARMAKAGTDDWWTAKLMLA